MPLLTFHRWIKWVLFFTLVSGVVLLLISFFGEPVIWPSRLFSDALDTQIWMYVRLPRIALGFLVGACLAVSGLAFQGLLNNPLADPYTLGISGGAALGGVLGLALHLPFAGVSITAFLAALGSMFLIYKMAQVQGRLPSESLLLTGIMFNAFCFAVILLINSLANLQQMQQILFLLMGSLEAVTWKEVAILSFFSILGTLILFFQSSSLNVLAVGENSAQQLGISADRHRAVVFVAASFLVGASVALCGLIGFVGLFVPHFMRLIFGNDHRLLVPLSFLGGGLFLCCCDFMVRQMFALSWLKTELPVGVMTAFLGGPFFFYLLKRSQR